MFVDNTTLSEEIEVSSCIQGSPILVTPQPKLRDFFDLQGDNIWNLTLEKCKEMQIDLVGTNQIFILSLLQSRPFPRLIHISYLDYGLMMTLNGTLIPQNRKGTEGQLGSEPLMFCPRACWPQSSQAVNSSQLNSKQHGENSGRGV